MPGRVEIGISDSQYFSEINCYLRNSDNLAFLTWHLKTTQNCVVFGEIWLDGLGLRVEPCFFRSLSAALFPPKRSIITILKNQNISSTKMMWSFLEPKYNSSRGVESIDTAFATIWHHARNPLSYLKIPLKIFRLRRAAGGAYQFLNFPRIGGVRLLIWLFKPLKWWGVLIEGGVYLLLAGRGKFVSF